MTVKISALPAVATPASTDEFEVNQGGTSKKETRAQIHALESGEVLLIDDGAVGAPGLALKSDTDTGLYSTGAGIIDIAVGGSQLFDIRVGGISSTATDGAKLAQLSATGTVPGLQFRSDTDTGVGRAAADQLSLIAGALEVIRCDGTVGTKGQVLLPQEDLAATPTLAFGDGDSGFFERIDDEIDVTISGAKKFVFRTDYFGGGHALSGVIFRGAGNINTPTIIPNFSDTNTGINALAEDQFSIVAGGIEGLRITEASSICTFDFDAGDNAAPQVGALTSLKSVSATLGAATAATLTSSNLIPAGSFVVGITIRVSTTFDDTASLTTFSVGDGADADRWGTGIVRTAGTTVDLTDATASPGGWFISANDIVFTADGGTFHINGGSADIIVHYFDLTAATG